MNCAEHAGNSERFSGQIGASGDDGLHGVADAFGHPVGIVEAGTRAGGGPQGVGQSDPYPVADVVAVRVVAA